MVRRSDVDYNDTTSVPRHFEDRFQYIGGGVGNYRLYPFSSGASCGNGINCPPPACVPVVLNGDPSQKIDIVFSGSGFSNQSQFLPIIKYILDYDEVGDGIMSFEPFSSYKDRFNVWFVDLYKIYNLHQKGNNFVFDNEVVRDAIINCLGVGNEYVTLSVTPRFRAYAINLVNGDFPIGYGGHFAYATLGCEILGTCPFPVDGNFFSITSANCDGNGLIGCNLIADSPSALQREVAHEFGHSFAGLSDEYLVHDTNTIFPTFAPNCSDNSSCSKWSSFSNITCDQNCFNPNWYRPYYNSLMAGHNWQRYEYGEVSETEIERDILYYQEGITESQDTMAIGLSFQNNSFILQGFNQLHYPLSIDSNFPSPYHIKVKSSSGAVLFDYNMLFPNSITLESPGELFDVNTGNQIGVTQLESQLQLDDFDFTLPVPIDSNASTIEIYDINGNVKLSINLLPTLNYCIGNGGNSFSNGVYNGYYAITGQPSSILTDGNYQMQLGWIP